MNRNSALIWLPAIEDAGLPTPKTIIVPYDHQAIMPIFDGEPSAELFRLSDAVMAAANKIGFPVFVRTDLMSAKHSGPSAYKIEEDGENSQIFETLEDSEMKSFMQRDGPQAFLVREFLTLESPFTAFRDFPVSREFRFFADGVTVHCWHPYWPFGSIDDHRPSREDWRDCLAELQREPEEIGELKTMAVRAAQACGGAAWSVDFCRDVNGKWWLCDMATSEDSYHWEDCVNAHPR